MSTVYVYVHATTYMYMSKEVRQHHVRGVRTVNQRAAKMLNGEHGRYHTHSAFAAVDSPRT